VARRVTLCAVLALAVLASCSGASTNNGGKPRHPPNTATTVTTAAPAGVTVATCDAAMKKYHDDLVASGGNLMDETADQMSTVKNCTRSMWLSEVAPYTGSDMNADIVVTPTSPEKVLHAFCSGDESAPACHG